MRVGTGRGSRGEGQDGSGSRVRWGTGSRGEVDRWGGVSSLRGRRQ